MNKDLHLEQAEAEFEERRRDEIFKLAARLVVVNGVSRLNALLKAREIFENCRDAEHDIRGVKQTLSENQIPNQVLSPQHERQIHAVYLDLLNNDSDFN